MTGVVCINKPIGKSSHFAVAVIRRITKIKVMINNSKEANAILIAIIAIVESNNVDSMFI